jgi:hypothetical protein
VKNLENPSVIDLKQKKINDRMGSELIKNMKTGENNEKV